MRLTEMSNKTNVKKINRVMESRFGFRIDYDNMTLGKAVTLAQGITEGLVHIQARGKDAIPFHPLSIKFERPREENDEISA